MLNPSRKPFKKHVPTLPLEEAHGGSGKRKLILSKQDPVSAQLEAMTKGFLAPGAIFDWHQHDDIDEIVVVLKGEGMITFADGTAITYTSDDVLYTPANTKHKLHNTGTEENEFLFIRMNH